MGRLHMPLVTLALASRAFASSDVIAWGNQVVDSRLHGERSVDVAAGNAHALAIRPNRTIADRGRNGNSTHALHLAFAP